MPDEEDDEDDEEEESEEDDFDDEDESDSELLVSSEGVWDGSSEGGSDVDSELDEQGSALTHPTSSFSSVTSQVTRSNVTVRL